MVPIYCSGILFNFFIVTTFIAGQICNNFLLGSYIEFSLLQHISKILGLRSGLNYGQFMSENDLLYSLNSQWWIPALSFFNILMSSKKKKILWIEGPGLMCKHFLCLLPYSSQSEITLEMCGLHIKLVTGVHTFLWLFSCCWCSVMGNCK